MKKYFYLNIVIVCLFATGILLSQTQKQVEKPGLKYLYYEKYQDGITYLQKLIKEKPAEVNAYFVLGKIYLATEKTDLAIAEFSKGNEIKTPNNLNAAGLIEAYLLKGDTSTALNMAREIADLGKGVSAELLDETAYALVCGSNNNSALVEGLLQKSITLDKKNYYAYFIKGEMFFRQSDGSNASTNYQKALDINPQYLPALLGQGKVYFKIRNFMVAENTFLEALNIDSTYSSAHRELSSLYASQKKYDKAEQSYSKYIQYSESSLKNKTKYSILLYQIKDYANAKEVCREILAVDPSNAPIQQLLAYSYYELNDFTNGIPVFEKFIKTTYDENNSATDYEYYGSLLEKAGKDSLAAIYYGYSIQKDSSRINVYGLLAGSYFRLKRFRDCSLNYELKEAKSGKNLSLREYFDMGQAYFYEKQYPLADTIFYKVTQIKSDLALGYLWRAFSNSSQDTTSELGLAKPHYEKFIEVAVFTPDKYKNQLIQAYSYLGYFYYLKQDTEEYKTTWKDKYKFYWTKVKELDPTNTQAIEALKNVK